VRGFVRVGLWAGLAGALGIGLARGARWFRDVGTPPPPATWPPFPASAPSVGPAAAAPSEVGTTGPTATPGGTGGAAGTSDAHAGAAGAAGFTRAKREGATLRISVDYDLCVSTANCMREAPEVFEVRDDGFLYLLQEEDVDPALRDKVKAAEAHCPTGAITVED
jgi:ferredoxin